MVIRGDALPFECSALPSDVSGARKNRHIAVAICSCANPIRHRRRDGSYAKEGNVASQANSVVDAIFAPERITMEPWPDYAVLP